MKQSIDKMWKDLKESGWEVDQTVNRDGDAITVLRDPDGRGVDVVDWKWVGWRAFSEAIMRAWKNIYG